MTDILNLPDWKAIATRQEGSEFIIEAEYTIQPKACQKCGVLDRLYRHGAKVTSYRDSPIRGAPVNILANVKRYRCRDCGDTFLQPLGSIQPGMRMTVRCVEYIKTQCLRDTFLRIAEHIGCDDKTVRMLADQHIAAMNLAFKPYLPEWLGIDEITPPPAWLCRSQQVQFLGCLTRAKRDQLCNQHQSSQASPPADSPS